MAFMAMVFISAPWAFQSSLVTVHNGKSESVFHAI